MDTPISSTNDRHDQHDQPEQLSLLPASSAPVRFRLDAETRRRGLIHVARMRALLAERRALREAAENASGRRVPGRVGAEAPAAPDRAA